MALLLKETAHRNKFAPFYSGASYDCGGIIGSVSLSMVPAVQMTDLFVRPDWRTGKYSIKSHGQQHVGCGRRHPIGIPGCTSDQRKSYRLCL